MKYNRKNTGLKRLIEQWKNDFDVEENLNYYSFEDFSRSRRKYLKFMLNGAECRGLHCQGTRL